MNVGTPNHKRLMDYLGKRGHVFAGAKEGKAVKWLLQHYDADSCELCFADLESQKWRTTAISWTTVAKEIAQWILRRQAANDRAQVGKWDGVETRIETPSDEQIRADLGYRPPVIS